jgi:hypothetical protein
MFKETSSNQMKGGAPSHHLVLILTQNNKQMKAFIYVIGTIKVILIMKNPHWSKDLDINPYQTQGIYQQEYMLL